MTSVFEIEKGEFSTTLIIDRHEICRIFGNSQEIDQYSVNIDEENCQFMPNNFLAFSVVMRATSSTETCLISAICSATSFT